MEIPLELDNKTLSLTELLDTLQFKRTWSEDQRPHFQGRASSVMRRLAEFSVAQAPLWVRCNCSLSAPKAKRSGNGRPRPGSWAKARAQK